MMKSVNIYIYNLKINYLFTSVSNNIALSIGLFEKYERFKS